jgi:WD40 repeat protein
VAASQDRFQRADPATAEHRHTQTSHNGTCFGVAFSPDGRLLAIVHQDNKVRVWNPSEATCRCPVLGAEWER